MRARVPEGRSTVDGAQGAAAPASFSCGCKASGPAWRQQALEVRTDTSSTSCSPMGGRLATSCLQMSHVRSPLNWGAGCAEEMRMVTTHELSAFNPDNALNMQAQWMPKGVCKGQLRSLDSSMHLLRPTDTCAQQPGDAGALHPTGANLRTPDCSHCSTRLHTPCAALQAPPCTGSPGLARCHSRNPVRVETHGSALKRAPSHAPSCIAANAQRCNFCTSQPQHVQHPAKPPIQQVPPSACAQHSTAHDKTASAHLRCQQLQANEADGHGRLYSAIGKAPIAAPLSHSPLTTHTTLLP